jgi:hypothetical protein
MKTIEELALVALLLVFFTLSGQSQNSQRQSSNRNQQKAQVSSLSSSRNYVDKDNNGVCDNFEAGKGSGKGVNFVDKNGDGICDWRSNASQGKGNNCKQGKGNSHRNGNACCGYGPGLNRHQNVQPKS